MRLCVAYVVKEVASLSQLIGMVHNRKLAQALQTSPAGRKVLVAYVETGTNSCSTEL